MKGKWPEHQIDHINRDATDDQWNNLREATVSQNAANQGCRATYGFKGVTLATLRGKWKRGWQAGITVGGKKYNLGYFSTPELAHAADIAAAEKHFGEFARAA